MEKNEITYILGAGASYQSFPVVKTFTARFNYFVKAITANSTIHHDTLEKELSHFLYEIMSHQSFDTYFKKLFHLKEDEQITKAKKIINLYFLWEQLEFPENSPYYIHRLDMQGNEIEPKNDDGDFKKQSLVDNRYDALIAGLLRPEKGIAKFFAKTNFITWNYDLNLISSIKNFIAPNELLNEFIKRISDTSHPNTWSINNDLQIINMNGHFFSSWLNDLRQFTHNDIVEIRNKLHDINRELNLKNHINEVDANLIKFAWEDADTKKHTVEKAKYAIQNSKFVIVLGYTFPSYNRLIDLEYFNYSTLSNTDIYIQDPRSVEIAEFLESDFGLYDGIANKLQYHTMKARIHTKVNCDSFFIPNRIYQNKN